MKWRIAALSFFCIFMVNCQKNNKQADRIVETAVESKSGYPAVDNTIHYPIENTNWDTTVCLTNVIENNVNVRKYPSINAGIIHQLNKDDIVTIIGYSGEKETIDGFEGTWLFVFKGTIKGWVFSKYVHIAAIEYAPIQFVDLIPTDNEHIPLIKISYELPGSVKIIEPDFISWKNYFIIVWGPYNKGLHNPTFNGRYCQGKRVAGYYCL